MELRSCLSKLIGCITVSVAAAVALPPSAHGQTGDPPAGWFAWRNIGHYQQFGCTLSRPLLAETTINLKTAALALTRVLPPIPEHGYPEITVQTSSPEGCGAAPVEGSVGVHIWNRDQVLLPANGQGRPKKKPHATEGGIDSIDFVFNRVPTGDEPDFASSSNNENPTHMMLYHPTSSIQGYSVMHSSAVVVTAPGHAPLYVPVPLERALKLSIAHHEAGVAADIKLVAETKDRFSETGELMKHLTSLGSPPKQLQDARDSGKQMIALVAQTLEKDRASLEVEKRRLAELSPAGKAGPAYVRRVGDRFLPQSEPGPDADPLVTPNPAYFDPKLPKSVPQLLVVGVFMKIDDLNSPGDDSWWHRRALHNVDWKTVAREILH